MIKALRALFGKTPRDHAAKKTVPGTKPKPSKGGSDYRAVSLTPGIASCTAAKGLAGKSCLSHEAPRLPLAACTMQSNCSCRFRKTADRRDNDRRLLGTETVNRWFAGSEQRKRERRRSAKD